MTATLSTMEGKASGSSTRKNDLPRVAGPEGPRGLNDALVHLQKTAFNEAGHKGRGRHGEGHNGRGAADGGAHHQPRNGDNGNKQNDEGEGTQQIDHKIHHLVNRATGAQAHEGIGHDHEDGQ